MAVSLYHADPCDTDGAEPAHADGCDCAACVAADGDSLVARAARGDDAAVLAMWDREEAWL